MIIFLVQKQWDSRLRNSKRALITLAAVNDELKKSNDFLKGIMPLFTPVAYDLSGQSFSPQVFGELLQKNYGLKIPEEILALFPARLQGLGLVERRTVNQSYYYFWKDKTSLPEIPESIEFSDTIENVVGAFQNFLDRDETLTARGWSRKKIEDTLFNYLIDSLDELTSAFDAVNGVEAEPEAHRHKSDEHYLASRFLSFLEDENAELFVAVGAVRNALVVSEVVMELGTQHHASNNQTDVTIYLDAPIVMDFLGLCGKQRKEFATQIILGLISLKARVAVFDHSVREMVDNLRGLLNKPPNQRTGPSASAMLCRELEEEYVSLVMHNPEEAIRKTEIQIVSNPLESDSKVIV